MKNTFEKLKRVPAKYGEFAKDHPYAATVAETLALRGLRMGINALSKKRGVNTGNALAGQYLDRAAESPIKSFAQLTLAAPVGEEIMARIIPGEVSKRLKERHPRASRGVKAASILGFAAVHSGILRFPEEPGDSKFPSLNTDTSKMSLPVSHFMSALNY